MALARATAGREGGDSDRCVSVRGRRRPVHDNGPGEGGPKVGCPGRREREGKGDEEFGIRPSSCFSRLYNFSF